MQTARKYWNLQTRISWAKLGLTLDLRKPRAPKQPSGIHFGHLVDNNTPFYIPPPTAHLYCRGRTRVGKSKAIQCLCQYHLTHGEGFGQIDAHGDLTQDTKGDIAVHYHRTGDESIFDTVLLDPSDRKKVATFNPLELQPGLSPAERSQQAAEVSQELTGAFEAIFARGWGNRMADLLTNSLAVLAESGFPLSRLFNLLSDQAFRRQVLEQLYSRPVREYFEFRFDNRSEPMRTTMIEPILNKLNQIFVDRRVGDIFSYPRSSFNLRQIMDAGKTLLVRLPKGELGPAGSLLGSLLLARIKLAAFSRTDILPSQRRLWYLYIDEFQAFADENFETVLSEAGKYAISYCMFHQYDQQLPTSLRHAVGNAGLQIYFRPVGRSDAESVAKELFRYSGFKVKRERELQSGAASYQYWSLGEEWERNTAKVQHLPRRQCYVRDTLSGKVILAHTLEMEDHWRTLSMAEEAYIDYRDSLPIGSKYLVDRERIAQESVETIRLSSSTQNGLDPDERALLMAAMAKQDGAETEHYNTANNMGVTKGNRVRDVLEARGLLVDFTARLNPIGRPRKLLIPTFEAYALLGVTPPDGRGGPIHRAIQDILYQLSLKKGYRPEKEAPLDNGICDLSLERDGHRTGVEIAVVSKSDREIAHMHSLLSAGYDQVCSLFVDERLMERTREAVQREFSEQDLAKITLLPVKHMATIL